MTERWTDRIKTGRTTVASRASDISNSAREAAEGATDRIGEVYGNMRSRMSSAVTPTKDRAGELFEAGAARAGKLAKDGRVHLDRAAIASRGLIAERPLTAVAIGIGAGLVLGFLANRLGRTQTESSEWEENEDDWLQ
jgi:ElaB/YqjD/DUF883 family membrane-anchored ribosome-binding protein